MPAPGWPLSAADGRVVLAAELDPGDVAERTLRAVGSGLDDDVAELLGRRAAATAAVTVALSIWPRAAGNPPIWPAATWVFCAWIAAITSLGISLKLRQLGGSSQMRIAYCEPNTLTSPTPGSRPIGSCRLETS